MSENTRKMKSGVTSIVTLPEGINKKSLEKFRYAKRLEDVPLGVRRREASEWVYLARYE